MTAGEAMGVLKRHLDECTREKHGECAGRRSASRVALVVGLAALILILFEAQLAFAGVLLDWWEWSEVAGYFQWAAAFTGGLGGAPYVGKHALSRIGGSSLGAPTRPTEGGTETG